MKEESLGLNHLLSLPATVQTVSPLSSAVSAGHRRTAPPQLSSFMPRCVSYQAASALGSLLVLKNTPPMPVIFAIAVSFGANHGYAGPQIDHPFSTADLERVSRRCSVLR